MKKKIFLILSLFLINFLPNKVLAYTAVNLNRGECSGNFELVNVTTSAINHVECYTSYNDALNAMNNTGIENGIPSIIYNNIFAHLPVSRCSAC